MLRTLAVFLASCVIGTSNDNFTFDACPSSDEPAPPFAVALERRWKRSPPQPLCFGKTKKAGGSTLAFILKEYWWQQRLGWSSLVAREILFTRAEIARCAPSPVAGGGGGLRVLLVREPFERLASHHAQHALRPGAGSACATDGTPVAEWIRACPHALNWMCQQASVGGADGQTQLPRDEAARLAAPNASVIAGERFDLVVVLERFFESLVLLHLATGP